MNGRTLPRAALLVMMLALAGCASTPSGPDMSRGVDPSLAATLKQGVAVPTIESNGHSVDDEVKASLIAGFKKQADKNGMPVSASGVPVKITVEEYNARSTAARVLLGVLIPGDHIKARVDVSGRTYLVEDTARTTINGIGLVAENVGSDAANGVATLAGVTVQTIQPVQPPVGMTTR
ncbi:hypothetical protein FP568_21705 [Pandoraea pnomenusa]|uniref:hypothetical protein n=1 Tax=Pandoraea pnomenusa TaxID=93220 RepID=UPI001198C514|nr:hypothetical protein [Pandoraea pnomenusa]QDX23569.1 hypothetical protein FP568_21705 [Pandoraea pnomenusa]